MNRIKKVISLTVAAAMLVSVAGCQKRVEKIDEDEIISAFEDVLDLEQVSFEESMQLKGESDYYYIVDPSGSSISISGYVHNEDDPRNSTSIFYIVSDDSEDKFASYYENMEPENGCYHKGDWGYFVKEEGNVIIAVYYADDMVLTVTAGAEENVEYAKEFINELGLPLE